MTLLTPIGRLLGGASAIILLLTIAAVPWMLGGLIPLARVTLLVGALAAGTLSLLAGLLCGRTARAVPLLVIPLAAMALLGTWQLRTVATHPIQSMGHAVGDVSKAIIPEGPTTATLLAADTRTTIATLLALSLVATTAFDRFRTSTSLMWGSLVFIINGIAATTIGLTQLFQNQGFSLNQEWALGQNKGSGAAAFASFINPNNAAGWLCLTVACAVGWLAYHLAKSGVDGKPQFGKLNIPMWEDTLRRSMQFVSDLTTWHILAISAVAFLGAGVAATQSRGGILALVIGVTIAFSLKSSLKRLPLVLLLLAACGGGVFGLLHWLELDESIVGEMETLKDLDDAAGTRPQHWLDSAHALLDFPLTGTGLGSYRFATLPYRSFTGTTWFRNADNHFMDILIEGGVIGLIMFVSIGLIGLMTGFAGWKEQKTRSATSSATTPRISRRLLGAVGSVAVVSTLTQAVSGFFDYGVGMPAASSLLIMILASSCGFLDESVKTPSPRRSASIACYPVLSVLFQIGLIAAGCVFIQDQWASAEIDKSVVDTYKALAKPYDPIELKRAESLKQTLVERLATRPDDAEGMRALTRLTDTEFRLKVLLAARGESVLGDKGFGMLWERSTIDQIMGSLAELDVSDPPFATNLRSQLTELANEVSLPEIFRRTQLQYPLMPQIAETRCAIAILQNDTVSLIEQANHAMFVQPANAAISLALGKLALQASQPELAKQLWDNSLKYSAQFRPVIMVNAAKHWSVEEIMDLFGPKNYAECVEAARNSQDNKQRQELLKRAEEIWNTLTEEQSESTKSVRAAHLVSTNRTDEAVKWLEECMKADGDNLIITRDLARLQEKQQMYRTSLDLWYRIQFHLPGYTEADAAITRIRNMK